MGCVSSKSIHQSIREMSYQEKCAPSLDAAIEESTAVSTTKKCTALQHSDFYWSNSLKPTLQQFTLLWDACYTVENSLEWLKKIHLAEKFAVDLPSEFIPIEGQIRYSTLSDFVAEGLKQAAALDKDHPLLQRSYQVMEQSSSLFSNRERVLNLALHNEAAQYFFNGDFRYSAATTFNRCCCNIANGTVLEEHFNPLGHDKTSFLQEMVDCYAQKEELRHQLSVAKQHLEKNRDTLDGDFVAIVEEAIHHTEAALKNMDHKERGEILERVQFQLRPMNDMDKTQSLYRSKKPLKPLATSPSSLIAMTQKICQEVITNRALSHLQEVPLAWR